MIEINLVPSQLRKKKRKKSGGGISIPLEVILGLGGGLIVILILVHLFLLQKSIGQIAHISYLKKQMAELQTAKTEVDGVVTEMRNWQSKIKAMEDLDKDSQVMWSQKLNIISDAVPRAVWLRRVALTDDAFFIEGSAISKEKREMADVHGFMGGLKKDKIFLTKLVDLELGSINSRQIGPTDVADFLISAKLKKKNEGKVKPK